MRSKATEMALIILAMVLTTSDGFSFQRRKSVVLTTSSALDMANGKGFGNNPPSPKKKAKKAAPEAQQIVSRADGTTVSKTMVSDNKDYNPFDASAASQSDTSRGKAALDRMRREQAEKRNAELQKMKQVQEVDKMMLETGGEAAVIPEKVAQRMGKRMLPFVGIPLLGGMAAFVGFWYMATYRDMEFQPVLVAGTTIALLAVGLVGITYSMMSASWDPEREGSVLGTDELSRNVENIKGGLARSRENAQVREQIMLEENRARQNQANEKPKKPAATSFTEKMGGELD